MIAIIHDEPFNRYVECVTYLSFGPGGHSVIFSDNYTRATTRFSIWWDFDGNALFCSIDLGCTVEDKIRETSESKFTLELREVLRSLGIHARCFEEACAE